jgi:NADH-quinone oxidoreductase subunit B
MARRKRTGDFGIRLLPLEKAVRWARTKSMWPLSFGLACCAFEFFSVGAAHYDLARFGMEYARPTPRQADLMVVAGRVTRKMAPVVRRLFEQMAEPRWVIAMGDCASCGGIFNNYAVVPGVDEIVPVDIYVAGCPPRPEALLHGILTLHHRIKTGEIPDVK